MLETILPTKLYVPPPPLRVVRRPRLSDRLAEGQHRTLTLVAAPAGFGKTTAVCEWVATCGQPVAWLSLDREDHNPTRFMTYLIAALQTIASDIGSGMLGALRSPQPPPLAAVLPALLSEITALISDQFVLVLDDYHVVDAPAIDDAITFLVEHLPPRMHLIITTREDPRLPIARLRARDQLTELRAADLRFTPAEAAAFLNDAMGLHLGAADIATLETRTEGWIAGLQLAAISMRGLDDVTGFLTSFTGTHRYVLDYLVEEVLQHQPDAIQGFLLRTSILERLCGPLCDALGSDGATPGQETLEYLERSNLFVVALDNERRWYRYHHLFAELLRQRLQQRTHVATGSPPDVAALHVRASAWFEDQGLEIEAFQHAAAANDIERAERLIMGKGMPLYLRGGLQPVLAWLESLPLPLVHARTRLCVLFATVLSVAGQITRVEPLLQAAEAALQDGEPDDETRDLVGQIAGMRALIAVLIADPQQLDTIIEQSHRALEYLRADNLRVRAATLWRLGLAYQRKRVRDTARRAFIDAIALSESTGNVHINILATTSLGGIEETSNQLHQAAETYHRALQLVGDPPGPIACEAFLGLAHIAYEWNDLDAAEQYGLRSVELARQLQIASFVSSELFLARLQLARGDVDGAIAAIAQTQQAVIERQFQFWLPQVIAAQVRALLRQDSLEAAAQLAQTHELPMSRARVQLAYGDAPAALATLEPLHQQAVEHGWEDERLTAIVLRAIAHRAAGELDAALGLLSDALAIAKPGGFIRVFIDEGPPMARLLAEARARGIRPDDVSRLLAALEAGGPDGDVAPTMATSDPIQHLVEPLSRRELEVLHLIAQGLSNREISERLFLALDTVKGHNRVIFGKLMVQRRTEAVARARELGIL